MFFVLSISSEVFCRMMKMRLLHRQLGIGPAVVRNTPESLQRVRSSFGGRMVLIDWRAAKVLADKPGLGVSGLAVSNRRIVASSWIDPYICIFENGRENGKVSHRWLNYVHSAELISPHSILIASAGSDLIAELTLAGELTWAWFGPEHGYRNRPDGLPAFFDRDADYRTIRSSTAEQAMHVTSAILETSGTVLATLFHQGTMIAIDRASGAARVVLDGLSRPHGVHRRDEGFVVSDTLGHGIILLDRSLKVMSRISFGSQWLQDAIETSDGTYLALENVHIDQMPDTELRNRIVEIDGKGRELRAVDIGADFRLFTAREVDEAHAHALAAAWGSQGNFGTWRWH